MRTHPVYQGGWGVVKVGVAVLAAAVSACATGGGATRNPNEPRTYTPVPAAKLATASFAKDYYGTDVETDVTSCAAMSQSAIWVPDDYSTDEYVAAFCSLGGGGNLLGLVIPKTLPCVDQLVTAGHDAKLHLQGGCHKPANPMVGSVVVADHCTSKP